jgi:hypothetical protein
VTYIGKRIKVGFAINGANPALNILTSSVTRVGFLKTGKLQVGMMLFQPNIYCTDVLFCKKMQPNLITYLRASVTIDFFKCTRKNKAPKAPRLEMSGRRLVGLSPIMAEC